MTEEKILEEKKRIQDEMVERITLKLMLDTAIAGYGSDATFLDKLNKVSEHEICIARQGFVSMLLFNKEVILQVFYRSEKDFNIHNELGNFNLFYAYPVFQRGVSRNYRNTDFYPVNKGNTMAIASHQLNDGAKFGVFVDLGVDGDDYSNFVIISCDEGKLTLQISNNIFDVEDYQLKERNKS